MTIKLNQLHPSPHWDFQVRRSEDGKTIELRDNNITQYFFDLTEERLLQKSSSWEDYIYLNHRRGIHFATFQDGWVKLADERLVKICNEQEIDEKYYGRGVIFSELLFEDDLLILIAKCPKAFRSISNDYYTEELLYKASLEFYHYKRPAEGSPIDNEILISFFNLKEGTLKKRLFLQDCDVCRNPRIEISKTRKELMLHSSERTFLLNYSTGNLLTVLQGENVAFIDKQRIFYGEWAGYNTLFGPSQILDSQLQPAYIFPSYRNDNRDHFVLELLDLKANENVLYFLCHISNDPDDKRTSICKIPVGQYDYYEYSNPVFSSEEQILSVQDTTVTTYCISAEQLLINHYPLSQLAFSRKKCSTQRTTPLASPLNYLDKIHSIDFHTTITLFEANGTIQSECTETGELLHQYKYLFDSTKKSILVAKIVDYLIANNLSFDAIVPVPPSDLNRPYQPLAELSAALAWHGYPLDCTFLTKIKNTPPIKEIHDPISRKEVLRDAFGVRDEGYQGKTILLFDDFYRSGETLQAAAQALRLKGGVAKVYALTITKRG